MFEYGSSEPCCLAAVSPSELMASHTNSSSTSQSISIPFSSMHFGSSTGSQMPGENGQPWFSRADKGLLSDERSISHLDVTGQICELGSLPLSICSLDPPVPFHYARHLHQNLACTGIRPISVSKKTERITKPPNHPHSLNMKLVHGTWKKKIFF